MSVLAVRRAVVDVLKSVTGISNVVEVLTFRTDPEWFLDHFTEPDGRVCGWQVATVEQPPSEHLGYVDRRLEVRSLGILGYRDEEKSRGEAEVMLQNVIAKFRARSNRRLSGAADWTEPPFRTGIEEAFVDTGEERIFVHRIEVVLVAVLETALEA